MLTPIEWVVFGFAATTVLFGLVFMQRLQTSAGDLPAQFQWHPELELRNKRLSSTSQPQEIDRWLHQVVSQSGIGMDLSTFLVANFCFAVVAGLIAWQLGANVIVQVGVAMATFALALAVVWFMFRGQRKKFNEQFPIALELMSSAVSAGETFGESVKVAEESTQEPVKSELRRCLSKMEMGMADDKAMELLAHRIPTMEVRIFAHTIAVHREMGGPLAKTLQRLAHVIQERREYQQKISSATSLGRFAAMMISAIGVMALIYLVSFQPEYIGKLLSSPIGIKLTVYAIVSEVIGIIWVLIAMGPEV